MKYGAMALGGALVMVAGAQAADAPVFLYPLMKQTVAPQAQILWDVGNRAYDDDGNVNVRKVTAADWARLGGAAQAMKVAALLLAEAPKVMVAPAGTKLQDEGAPGNATAVQIQGFIDADRKDFAAHARALADVSEAFLTASRTKDGQTLADASGKLDEVCEACHIKYWYPQ